MDKVIPVIVVCSVGIAAALGYIAFVIVRSIMTKHGARPRNEFEIEDDTLVIKLGRKRKGK